MSILNEDDSYYNPDTYNTNSEQSIDVTKTIADTAKHIITFAGAVAASRAIGGLANAKLGKAIQMASQSAARSGSTSSLVKRIANIQETRTATSLFRELPQVRNSPLAQRLIAKSDTNHYLLEERKSLINAYVKNERDNGKIAFKGAMRLSTAIDKRYRGAVAGHLLKEEVFAGSAVMYGMDTLSGKTSEMGLKDPGLNPLNHLSNYAQYVKKTAGESLAGGLLFRGLGAGVSSAFKATHNVLQSNKAFHNAVMSNIVEPFSRFRPHGSSVKGANSSAYNAYTNIVASVKTLNESIFNSGIGRERLLGGWHSSNKISYTKNLIKDVQRDWKKHKDEFANRKRDYDGQSFIAAIRTLDDKHSASSFDGKNFKSGQSTQFQDTLFKMVEEYDAKHKSRSTGNATAQILGLKQATVGDMYRHTEKSLHEQVGFLKNKFNSESKFNDFVSKLESATLDKHAFVHDGKVMDMRNFSPLHVARRVAQEIGQVKIKLPFAIPPMSKDFQLGQVFGLNTILSHEAGAASFNNETGLGLVVKNKLGRYQTLAESLGINRRDLRKRFALEQHSEEAYDTMSHNLLSASELRDSKVIIAGNKAFSFSDAFTGQLNIQDVSLKYARAATNGGPSEVKALNQKKWLFQNRDSDASNVRVLQEAFRPKRDGLFAGLLNKLDVNMPSYIKTAGASVRNLLTPGRVLSNGKYVDHNTSLYATATDTFFGENVTGAELNNHVGFLHDMLESSTHGVSNLMKIPHVRETLIKHSNYGKGVEDSQFETVDNILSKLRSGSELTGHSEDTIKALSNDNTFKSAFNEAKIYEGNAKSHIMYSRHDNFSEMTDHDYVSTKIFSHQLTINHTVADRSNPSYNANAFINASRELEAGGYITKSQANAMRVHGKLQSAFAEVRYQQNNNIAKADYGLSIQRSLRSGEFDAHQELIDFISTNRMRSANSTLESQHKKIMSPYDYAMTGASGGTFRDSSPFVAISYNGANGKVFSNIAATLDIGSGRLMNMIHDLTGFNQNPFDYGNGIAGAAKYVGTVAAKIGALNFAYNAVDTAFAANPIFDNSMLDDGITGAGADILASGHLGATKIADLVGVTRTAKYLEGLMPGSSTTIPGAIIGGALRAPFGMMSMLGGAATGALANRIIAPYTPALDKSYEERKREYSGIDEVPIIEGKGWLLGSTPWQGKRVIGWQPNWYVKTKSRWEASDTMYGSELGKLLHKPIFPLGIAPGDLIDPYYMDKLHFYDRPYAKTGGLGEDIPFGLGAIISNTIGQAIKPTKIMHQEFLYDMMDKGQANRLSSSIMTPSYSEVADLMSAGNSGSTSLTSREMGSFSYEGTQLYGHAMAEQALSGLESGLGIVGFASSAARQALDYSSVKFKPMLESSGTMSSQSRAYENMNLGGMGIFSEGIRRFMVKNNYKNVDLNPIPNLLPNWLPDRFLKGDPYTKINSGELRLPGVAYEQTHHVKHDFGARASMFGAEEDEIVRYFTGFSTPLERENFDILESGTEAHKLFQDYLYSQGSLLSAEDLLVDTRYNITGHIDGVLRDDRARGGKRALEIKTISKNGLDKLTRPKNQHIGQLNFYLHNKGFDAGTIIYVDRDDPSNFKTFEMNYDRNRFFEDVNKLQRGRAIAQQMIKNGVVGDGYGYSYSWADKLKILADVAPASKEYKEAKQVVEMLIKKGELDDDDMYKYKMALKHRSATLRKFELNPTRFKGQIMSPDSVANIQSINENIKAANQYNVLERSVGAAWEEFTNLNTPLINKFWSYKDDISHYKMMQLYSKEYQPWTDPFGSFIAPKVNSIFSADDAVEGAGAGFSLGYMFGGAAGGLVSGALGSAYGAVSGLARNVFGGAAWIPDKVENQRNINTYFDQLKYTRGKRMSALDNSYWGQQEWTSQANNTLTSMIENGSSDYTTFFRSVAHSEKPYIESFLKTTNLNERKEILKYVPNDLAVTLTDYWKTADTKISQTRHNDYLSSSLVDGRLEQRYTDQELDPNIQLDDIKLKLINKEGLNAHDFGLGWQDQMLRVQNQLDELSTSNRAIDDYRPPIDIDGASIKSAIYNVLAKYGVKGSVRIFVNNHSDGLNNVNITVQSDRLQDIRNSLDYRERFVK